jgi:hypothetical protein
MKYETIGLPVYPGVVPIKIVEELVGGVAVTIWRRLYPWVKSIREEQSADFVFEWFQWLFERLQDRGRDVRDPAQIMDDDWLEYAVYPSPILHQAKFIKDGDLLWLLREYGMAGRQKRMQITISASCSTR